MINLIEEMLNPGDQITLYLTGETEPLYATFVKASDSAVAVRLAAGLCVVGLDSIIRFVIHEKSVEVVTESSVEKIGHQVMPAADDASPSHNQDMTHDDDPIDSESFSPIFMPKIVGRIDLDSIHDPRKKRHYDVTPTADNPLVPAGGVVNSIGPAFGFITASDGESLFFSRGEIMQRNRAEEIHKGMPVVFTPGRNAKGGVARCVHVQTTMQEQLEWIEKIEQYDPRNARMMAEQLLLAFPDDAELTDTLSSFDIRPHRMADNFSRIGVPVADKTLEAVELGHYVEPSDLLRAEKEISATRPYEDAYSQINRLLEFAMTNSRQQCYQLFVRLVKLTRNQGDLARTSDIIDRAIAFYADESGARRYFDNIRQNVFAEAAQDGAQVADDAHECVMSEEEVVDAVCNKIMRHVKNDVVIFSDNSEVLASGMNSIHGNLADVNECVCGRVDVAAITIDEMFERRFYYSILKSLSDAVADKFDTEFQMPEEDKFIGTDVTDMAAMMELSDSIRDLYRMLNDRPDASARRMHIVCMIENLDLVLNVADNDCVVSPSNLLRHLKVVADNPGKSAFNEPAVNMQLILSGSQAFKEGFADSLSRIKTFSAFYVK